MHAFVSLLGSMLMALIVASLAGGCGASDPPGGASTGGSSGGAAGTAGPASGGGGAMAGGAAGAGPAAGGAGGAGEAGASGTGGGTGTATGGAGGHTAGAAGGTGGTGGAGGAGGVATADASTGDATGRAGGDAAAPPRPDASVPPGCTLPATVSYQRDVQPFLIASCGGGNGCHVIDAASTMANGGFNHGYDWITGGAHASSCPETPTPKRFEVAIDVINKANPPTCSKSRKMPPPNATGAGVRAPLTPCQIATLQAWLSEPMVTQTHRVDDSSPTTPYAMPPFN